MGTTLDKNYVAKIRETLDFQSGFETLVNEVEQLERLVNRIDKLRELPKIQHESTTPMDDYHTGMYNGLICALSILDERELEYMDVEKKRPS